MRSPLYSISRVIAAMSLVANTPRPWTLECRTTHPFAGLGNGKRSRARRIAAGLSSALSGSLVTFMVSEMRFASFEQLHAVDE